MRKRDREQRLSFRGSTVAGPLGGAGASLDQRLPSGAQPNTVAPEKPVYLPLRCRGYRLGRRKGENKIPGALPGPVLKPLQRSGIVLPERVFELLDHARARANEPRFVLAQQRQLSRALAVRRECLKPLVLVKQTVSKHQSVTVIILCAGDRPRLAPLRRKLRVDRIDDEVSLQQRIYQHAAVGFHRDPSQWFVPSQIYHQLLETFGTMRHPKPRNHRALPVQHADRMLLMSPIHANPVSRLTLSHFSTPLLNAPRPGGHNRVGSYTMVLVAQLLIATLLCLRAAARRLRLALEERNLLSLPPLGLETASRSTADSPSQASRNSLLL
jgi:hypothetical protein